MTHASNPSNESKGFMGNLSDAKKAGAGVLMVVALVGAGIWWWKKDDASGRNGINDSSNDLHCEKCC